MKRWPSSFSRKEQLVKSFYFPKIFLLLCLSSFILLSSTQDPSMNARASAHRPESSYLAFPAKGFKATSPPRNKINASAEPAGGKKIGETAPARFRSLVFDGDGTGELLPQPAPSVNTAAAPQIFNLDPSEGMIGSSIHILGMNFGANQGSSYVSFDTTTATHYLSWSDTAVEVVVPYGNYSDEHVDVQVHTPGGNSNITNFELVPWGLGFAEGYTGADFQEFLCLGNPDPNHRAKVLVIFQYPSGDFDYTELTITPYSRSTIDINAVVGPDLELSLTVLSDIEIVAERPMYFNYGGRWTGGHDVTGIPWASTEWYFAEGYTGPGFDEYICVLNPGDEIAYLTFYFQTENIGLVTKSYQTNPLLAVRGGSRGTFKINNLLGPNYANSLKLVSTKHIVAERPMYFDYTGGGGHWSGGHCVIGLPGLLHQFYFAEGTTLDGFNEWLTIQNPSSESITVGIDYVFGPGQGSLLHKEYIISPNQRKTIYVANDVGRGKDVSARLSSSSEFLAERPMYFRYQGWTGGHCVIGAFFPDIEWLFAEGYTGPGFHEYLCIQNNEDYASYVKITYLVENGSSLRRDTMIPAHTRATLGVNDHAGKNINVSCKVEVTSGAPIIAERPMYFNFGGWDGGHDVVGYQPFSYPI